MSVTYSPNRIRAYHRHEMGRSWIPTAPKEAQDAKSIEIRDLTAEYFVRNLPRMTLKNTYLKRWFPTQAVASSYSISGDLVEIDLDQKPGIEGVCSFAIKGNLVRPLSFLDGNALIEIAVRDHFSFGRRLRIYHNGHSAARLGIQHSARFNSVTCASSDGVRTRFLYRPNQTGFQMATIYVASPSNLYELLKPDHGGQVIRWVHALKPDFVLDVIPRRSMEWKMLDHGNAYDHGIIGAEVAYAIASRMLMTDQLLMREPAMGGSDLVSRDGSTAVEARMLAGVSQKDSTYFKTEVRPHMQQMVGRLRRGRAQKAFGRGVAILCVRLGERRIVAMIKEV